VNRWSPEHLVRLGRKLGQLPIHLIVVEFDAGQRPYAGPELLGRVAAGGLLDVIDHLVDPDAVLAVDETGI